MCAAGEGVKTETSNGEKEKKREEGEEKKTG